MMFLKLAFIASFYTVLTYAAAPLPPTNDPFYTPPCGFEDAKPGSVLRNRPVPNPLSPKLEVAAAYQILYRTTDTFGNAIATVTTVLVPHNATNTQLLSYQIAEDAAYLNCAPSYVFQQGSETGGPGGTVITETELDILKTALENKWYITVPDFEGPKAAFLANNLAGHAVLDGIRATLALSNTTGLGEGPTISIWGYSSGGFATGFAAELQPTYAPELQIAAAVVGGPVGNILNVLYIVNKSVFAGLIPAGILGLGNEYPEAAALIDEQLLPEKREKAESVRSLCLGAVITDFLLEDVFTYVKDRNIFNSTLVSEITAANDLGQHTPRIPMLVYKAIDDEVSPVADSDKLIQSYCDSGATVDYRRVPSSSHIDLLTTGAPMAMDWLKDRFDGVTIPQGCVKS